MDVLQQLIPLAFSGALALLVLAVGLDARVSDITFLLRRPGLLARAFVAICIVVPVTAAVMIAILPMAPVTKAGVMLMAVAPVPPLVPGKGLKLGGRKEYVYSLYLVFALLAVIIVPISIVILDAVYGQDVTVAPATIASTIAGSVLAPMAIGLICHHLFPKVSEAASVWISRLSMILLVLACIPIFIHAWPAISSLVGDGTVLAVIVISIAAIAAGHLLGGSDPQDRVALAGAAATRHPGLALLIAHAAGADARVSAAILLYLLIALLTVTIYQIALKRAAHRPSALASGG